jgi:hypothetical protein
MTGRRLYFSDARVLCALAIGFIFLSSVAQRYLGNVLNGPNGDFYDYYFAGQIIHDNPHANLYEGAIDSNPQLRSAPSGSEMARRARSAGFSDIELYLYPPLLADLMSPMARLQPRFAAELWRALNIIFGFTTALLLARAVGLRWLSLEFAVLAVMTFAFWPFHEAISLGQIAVVILLLWAIGVTAYVRGYREVSAAAFSVATMLKVTPLLVVPLFLIWKERRWLIWYGGTLLALAASMAGFNGLDSLRTSVKVLTAMKGSVPVMQNKCFGALLGMLHYGRLVTMSDVQPLLNGRPEGLLSLAKPLSLAFYALCLWLVWRRRGGETSTSRAQALAIFALVIAAISPVSWRHGYTVALIPLTMLWVEELRSPAPETGKVDRRALRRILLALTTVTMGSLAFDLIAQMPLPQPLKILSASTWLLFSVALCLESLRWRSRRETSEAL